MDLLSGIRADMADFNGVFDTWYHDTQTALEQHQRTYRDTVKEANEEIGNLALEHRKLLNVQAQQKKECEEENRRVAVLQDSLHKWEQEANILPTQIEAVKETRRTAEKEKTATITAMKTAERQQQQRINKLQETMRPYQQALGLNITANPIQGELSVTFTQIDRASPSTPYSFSVCTDSQQRYEIRSCQPPLTEMTDLLNQLNEEKELDFSMFVAKVRQAFKALAAKSATKTDSNNW